MLQLHHPSRLFPVVIAALSLLVVGCGGSSKPSYCSKVSQLEKSVKDLPSSVSSNGLSALKGSLQTVEANAQAVLSAAKSDFPRESTAVTSSLDSLRTSVQQLPSSPTAANLITVATQVSSLVSAAKSFASATSSKCG